MTVSVSSRMRVGLLALVAVLAVPFVSSANNECGFSRTLDLGVEGQDVQCLQQFLNDAGYTIATEGPGSLGNETTRFGGLTEAAVIRWQEAKGVVPASGVFGPQSQAAYLLDVATRLEEDLAARQAAATPAPLSFGVVPQVAGVTTVTDETVVAAFIEALELIEDADDEVEHRILTGEPYQDHMRDLNKAKREFFAAATAYFTGDLDEAYDILGDVLDRAEDATDEEIDEDERSRDDDDEDDEEEEDEDERDEDDDKSDDEDREDAWDAIDDAWDEYQEVREYLEDEDAYSDDARDYLKAAANVLQDAEVEAENGDYDDVFELVDEAESLIEEAEDLA